MLKKSEAFQITEKLRKLIDSGKDVKTNQEELSMYYIISSSEGGLTYSFDDLTMYLQDYIVRNISTAEVFIDKAIEENRTEVFNLITTHFRSEKDLQETKVEELKDKIAKLIEDRAYHYICDPEDPKAIRFDIANIKEYITDWLSGIADAESFVLQGIANDFNTVKQIFYNLESKKEIKKLFTLITSFDHIDPSQLIVMHYQKEVISAKNTQEIAKILDAAYSAGILSEVLESNKCLTIAKNNFEISAYLKYPEVFCKIFNKLTDEDNYLASLYSASFMNFYSKNREVLIASLIDINKNRKPEQGIAKFKTASKLNERIIEKPNDNIQLDYYIASINKDEESFKIISSKNPKMFNALFSYEIYLITEYDRLNKLDQEYIKGRYTFYQNITQDREINVFLEEKHRTLLNDILVDRFSLPPIGISCNEQPTVIVTLKNYHNVEENSLLKKTTKSSQPSSSNITSLGFLSSLQKSFENLSPFKDSNGEEKELKEMKLTDHKNYDQEFNPFLNN